MYEPTERVHPPVASTTFPPSVLPSFRPTSINRTRSSSFPGPPVVPVAPQQARPEARVGRVVAVAAVDLLVGGPLDVAGDDQSLAVREPERIGYAVRQIRHAPRLPARDRQYPELGTVLSGGDERERRAVGGPARLAVGARALREPAGLPGRHLGQPDPRRAAVVLEGVVGDRVRDPSAVGGELRIAHRLQRDVVVERDGALLSS